MATARPRYQLGGRILVNDLDLRMPTVAACSAVVGHRWRWWWYPCVRVCNSHRLSIPELYYVPVLTCIASDGSYRPCAGRTIGTPRVPHHDVRAVASLYLRVN